MSVQHKTACIFGGTGFIGHQIVRELAKAGYRVKVATRVPERAYILKTCGNIGQIVPVFCDYGDDESLREAVQDCQAVVNCIGILFEKGKKASFQALHTELPGRIAKICAEEAVDRLVHISALGVEQGTSKYAKTKLEGETAVRENFPDVSILRPSVVFGPGDDFFNMFARLSALLPALPLIGGGGTKFQPVYVGDVADAVIACLQAPATSEDRPQGKIYELGGPDVLSFREIYERLFEQTGRRRTLVSIPWGMAKIQGAFMGLMPRPLLTCDQVESLKTDTVVSEGSLTLQDLGITPAALDTILPTYLSRHRPGGRFGDKKTA